MKPEEVKSVTEELDQVIKTVRVLEQRVRERRVSTSMTANELGNLIIRVEGIKRRLKRVRSGD